MDIATLQEVLTTFANSHPFQSETDKNEFQAKIDSLSDKPKTEATKAPAKTAGK